jgi:hypothetical protein
VILGTLGSSHRATAVAGSVLRLPFGIEVAWWIGADDRWHIPDQEITIRHSLVGAAPVLRTAVRVPGGDAVATVAAMRQGQRDLAVLDIANESPSPFAIAFVLRGPGVRDAVLDGSTLRIGGRPILTIGRVPQFVCSVAPGGDLLGALRDRQAVKPSDGPVSVDRGGAEGNSCEVAVLVPVAHRSRIRAAILIGADTAVAEAGSPVVSALKDPSTSAAGWSVHVQRAPGLHVPDAAIHDRMAGLAASLLLAADAVRVHDVDLPVQSISLIARALDRLGFFAESERLIASFDDRQGGRGDIGNGERLLDSVIDTANAVVAIADHVRFSGDAVAGEAMAPVVAGGLEFIQRNVKRCDVGPWTSVFRCGASMLERADEPRAAAAAMKEWVRLGSHWPVPIPALPPLPAVSAGADLLPSDPMRLAAEAVTTIDGIVGIGSDDVIDILPAFPKEWLGQSLDVRNVATPAGSLSFAIRWHGARPALLWEVAPGHVVTASEPVLVSSTLDPVWSGRGRTGEALLQQPAIV